MPSLIEMTPSQVVFISNFLTLPFYFNKIIDEIISRHWLRVLQYFAGSMINDVFLLRAKFLLRSSCSNKVCCSSWHCHHRLSFGYFGRGTSLLAHIRIHIYSRWTPRVNVLMYKSVSKNWSISVSLFKQIHLIRYIFLCTLFVN